MAGQPIPNYLVGRNCAAFYGADLYISSSGNIVAGNSVDYHALGVLDTFECSFENGLVEISALDAYAENNLPTKTSFEFSVGELRQPGGSSKLLNVSFNQSTLFGVELYTVDPATGSGAALGIVGRIRSIRDGLVTGKNATVVTCVTAGIMPFYYPFGGGGLAATQSGGISTGNIRTGPYITSTK